MFNGINNFNLLIQSGDQSLIRDFIERSHWTYRASHKGPLEPTERPIKVTLNLQSVP